MYYFDLYDTSILSNRREVLTRLVQVFGVVCILLALIYYVYPPLELGRGIFVIGLSLVAVNGYVERSHRTHREEFYQVIPDNWTVAHLNPQLRRWEHIYNTVRPHQALGYLTPLVSPHSHFL